MMDMTIIGSRIRGLRQQKGWSQAQLVIQATPHMPDGQPFDRSTLSLIETGERSPGIQIVMALAATFGVTSDYILGLAADPSPSAAPVFPVPEWDVAPLVDRLNALPKELRRRTVAVLAAILDLLPPAT